MGGGRPEVEMRWVEVGGGEGKGRGVRLRSGEDNVWPQVIKREMMMVLPITNCPRHLKWAPE